MEEMQERSGLATLPVIVYTGTDLTKKEETQLKRMAKTIIVKDVRSPERLLDETALFLHRVQSEHARTAAQNARETRIKTDEMLARQESAGGG